jgi:hypothetical protein
MKRLERQRPTEKVRGLWEDDEWSSSVSCMCCSGLFFSMNKYVARQRLTAAPRRQARSKGSPGVNNVCQGLFL